MEKQQFFGHWRWVHVLTCPNGHVMRLLGGDTRRRPQLFPGAVRCACGADIRLG